LWRASVRRAACDGTEKWPGTACRGHSLAISGKECLPDLTILLAALTLAALSALTGLICLVLLSALLAAALLATLLTALVLLVRAFVRHAVPLSGVVQHHINRSCTASVPESRCGNIVHRAVHAIVPDPINSKRSFRPSHDLFVLSPNERQRQNVPKFFHLRNRNSWNNQM
jgi:hypothetical protein